MLGCVYSGAQFVTASNTMRLRLSSRYQSRRILKLGRFENAGKTVERFQNNAVSLLAKRWKQINLKTATYFGTKNRLAHEEKTDLNMVNLTRSAAKTLTTGNKDRSNASKTTHCKNFNCRFQCSFQVTKSCQVETAFE